MARTPTTADAFNAVAEASRRDLLDALGTGEATVGELVDRLGLTQPQVSKHLGVLRKVGLVRVVRQGKRRVYSLNGEELRPVYDWVKTYERFWDHQLRRVKDRAEQKPRESTPNPRPT